MLGSQPADLARTHEEGFVNSFIAPAKRARYLMQLEYPKKRTSALAGLSSGRDIESSRIIHKWRTTEDRAILSMLEGYRVPEQAYLIVDGGNNDRTWHLLDDVITILHHESFGVVASLIAGRIALYKHENPSPVYLLCRHAGLEH